MQLLFHLILWSDDTKLFLSFRVWFDCRVDKNEIEIARAYHIFFLGDGKYENRKIPNISSPKTFAILNEALLITKGPFKKYVTGLGGEGVKQNSDKEWQGGRGSKIRIFTVTYFLNGPYQGYSADLSCAFRQSCTTFDYRVHSGDKVEHFTFL